MATSDDQLVTAKGLAQSLSAVSGGGSPLDAWPVGSCMVTTSRLDISLDNLIGGKWTDVGSIDVSGALLRVYARSA